MLYLIGGPPRCGKTTLSRALAMSLEIPYFSIDHIASVITPYLSAESQENGFAVRTLYRHVGGNNDRLFARYSSEEIVDAYRKQAVTCWPGVKNFIQYAIDDGHSLILEGWQLLPHLLNEVSSAEAADKVRVKYLYKTDLTRIRSGLKANREENDWVLKNTKEEGSFTRIAAMISQFSSYIQKEAAAAGFDTLNTDSDFVSTITSARDSWVTSHRDKAG